MNAAMKRSASIGLFAGLCALALVFAWQGIRPVAGRLGEAGWSLLWVCVFAPPVQLVGAEAWRRLFPPDTRPGVWQTLAASWMGSAVNTLLPVATIGGEVVKARLVTIWHGSFLDAASTAVVDKTVQGILVLFWTLAGVVLFSVLVPDPAVLAGAAGIAAALALGIGGFVALQLGGGVTFLARRAARWQSLSVRIAAMHEGIRDVYRRPGSVVASCAYRVLADVVPIGEILLAAHLMGHPLGIFEAAVIRGLTSAMRGLAFMVPGALGVQEGGYVAMGALLGEPPELMVALSLASRVREILPNVPFLIAWQRVEGIALIRRGRRAKPPRGSSD
ncbi:MAG: lysylphosphatidylglycerol synthase domain-containing protein [Rhodospirillales bacterium]|jgi:putative membrane protein|nr:lysylphosphatidylglycerol synthase domain-containing protein [Rhodospirillales bacterium]